MAIDEFGVDLHQEYVAAAKRALITRDIVDHFFCSPELDIHDSCWRNVEFTAAMPTNGWNYSVADRVELAATITSEVIQELIPSLVAHIGLLPEGEATPSRDFGRGYAHAIQDVITFLVEVATP